MAILLFQGNDTVEVNPLTGNLQSSSSGVNIAAFIVGLLVTLWWAVVGAALDGFSRVVADMRDLRVAAELPARRDAATGSTG
jgi:hypothetical protein